MLSCYVHVASVDQLTYDEFIRSIPTPTTLAVINLSSPMEKQAIIEIGSSISFIFINRAFGGNEKCIDIEQQHELTRLEWLVMNDVINELMNSMEDSWARIIDLAPNINHTDTNPQFLNIVPPTEMTILVTLVTKIDGVEGMINISYPYSCLEGVMDKLSTAFWSGLNESPMKNYKLTFRENIPVEITAEIFKRNYLIKDVLGWKSGDILFPLRTCLPSICYLRLGNKRVWVCKILDGKIGNLKKIGLIKVEYYNELEDRMEVMDKANPAVYEALSEVSVTISVELGKASMPIKDILSLAEGSIVELDKLSGEFVDIKANGVTIAKGEVVVIEDTFGVRIVEIAKTPNQVNEPNES